MSDYKVGDIVQAQDGKKQILFDAKVLAIHNKEVKIKYTTSGIVENVDKKRIKPYDLEAGRPSRPRKTPVRIVWTKESLKQKVYDEEYNTGKRKVMSVVRGSKSNNTHAKKKQRQEYPNKISLNKQNTTTNKIEDPLVISKVSSHCNAVTPLSSPKDDLSVDKNKHLTESTNFFIKKELWQKKGFKSKGMDNLNQRQLTRRKYLFDVNGQPRMTFRRMKGGLKGGSGGSIATLLGGLGTDPWPSVKTVPPVNGKANPFVKKNEVYVACRHDWNPWIPCYAGDSGFMDHRIFDEMPEDQKQFHVFIRTSKKPYEGHYYGPDAKDKYIYIGKFQKDLEAGVEAIDEPYRQFSEESQLVMAKEFRRYYGNEQMRITCPSGNKVLISNEGMQIDQGESVDFQSFETMEASAKEVHFEEWEKSSREKQEILVWLEMLFRADYHVKVVPVEFVEYDEDMYQALVEMDAANGQITEDENQLGPV